MKEISKKQIEEFKLDKRTPEEREHDADIIAWQIELRYYSPDEQLAQTKEDDKEGYTLGNEFFTEEQLPKLRDLKPDRDDIWDKIIELDPSNKLYFELATKIDEGFSYLVEDEFKGHKKVREYLDAKKRIHKHFEDYIKKQNAKLVKKDPYFENYPIRAKLLSEFHHLDSSTKAHRPPEHKIYLIEDLSALIETYLPETMDRARMISRIFACFYDLKSDPRNIRKHF